LVEQWFHTPPVASSILAIATSRKYNTHAGVAQLVEHFLAKEDVVSSNLITRSKQNSIPQ
jgi:hypothetical protein